MRKLALICLSPPFDGAEMPLPMPSYGVHRIHAAALSAQVPHPTDTRLFDFGELGLAQGIRAVLDFGPDVIGASVYVWSLMPLLRALATLRKGLPGVVTLLGGPSARRAALDHPAYRDAARVVDALCEDDGEAVVQALLAAPDLSRATLGHVPGLWLRDGAGGWIQTGVLAPLPLSAVPSPYQQGLMPAKAVAYLETYRGCPLSCRFCEWGLSRPAREVFDTDYLTAELSAFRRLEAPAVFLLDAGLNLNARGFRNLAAAHAREGFLSDTLFWAEIYPTIIKPDHLDFLRSVGTAYLGVGLQSMDEAVLRAHDRPFDMSRFAPAVDELARVAGLEVQIIMGLPEDTPEGFRRTLDFALSLPVQSVRVYHCLVLPDALLTRARPDWQVRFDAATMAMTSNHTWSAAALAAMRNDLTDRVARHGGQAGEFWWSFRK